MRYDENKIFRVIEYLAINNINYSCLTKFYRWVIMVLYFMPSMMNAIGWITFSPISTQIE